jgi:hypothetical protein
MKELGQCQIEDFLIRIFIFPVLSSNRIEPMVPPATITFSEWIVTFVPGGTLSPHGSTQVFPFCPRCSSRKADADCFKVFTFAGEQYLVYVRIGNEAERNTRIFK